MPHRLLVAIGWLAAIYAALVLQTTLVPQVSLTAAVAAWAVSRSPIGVWWAAGAGVACDAAGHDRLGLHLATYAILGALATAVFPPAMRRTGSARAVIAVLIAGGDEAARSGLATMLGRTPGTLQQTMASAVESAVMTASVVMAFVCVIWTFQRLLSSAGSGRPIVLANRWNMLTE